MAITTVSFTTNFDVTTKTINITDTTNYAGGGVALTDAVGVLAVTDPTATQFYNNTDYNAPDINPDVSLVNSTTISIPEPTADELLLGNYTITYTVKVDNGVDAVYYVSASVTVDFNYCSPEVTINQTADCVAPLFASVDNTTYTVNGVAPTITRAHSLYFPPGSGLYLTPTVTTGATINAYTFYTGPQTTIVESTLSYNYGGGFTVTDVVQGQVTMIVDCDGVCAVYCCMKALETRRTNAKGVNKKIYDELTATLNICMSLMSLAKFSLECGEQSDAQGYMDKILVLSNCNDDCGCGNDGTPQLVTGLSSASTIDAPWTYVDRNTNDDAILSIFGGATSAINSIGTLRLKYKKVGTMATLNWVITTLNMTRAVGAVAMSLVIAVPSDIPLANTPFVAVGQGFLANQTTGELVMLTVGGASAGFLSYNVPVSVMPNDVTPYNYTYQGSITYETTA